MAEALGTDWLATPVSGEDNIFLDLLKPNLLVKNLVFTCEKYLVTSNV